MKYKGRRGIKDDARIWPEKLNRWWQHLLRRKRLVEGPIWNRRRNQKFWLNYIKFNMPIKDPSKQDSLLNLQVQFSGKRLGL